MSQPVQSCKKCGELLARDAGFCGKCGCSSGELPEVTGDLKEVQASQSPQSQNVYNKRASRIRNRNMRYILSTLAIVVVLILVVSSFFSKEALRFVVPLLIGSLWFVLFYYGIKYIYCGIFRPEFRPEFDQSKLSNTILSGMLEWLSSMFGPVVYRIFNLLLGFFSLSMAIFLAYVLWDGGMPSMTLTNVY
ncbi:MAG: hypothetical protein EPN25_00345 [Nitrospirae bacterium]|nr:MAG: hypothetical protein EPN25_00345 [Nitrospirota bacterium]